LIEAEIYDALQEIFNDIFFRDDIEVRPSLTARDVPGWDSFKQVEIIIAAEQRFRVKLLAEEIDEISNVGDLVRALSAKPGVCTPVETSS
jgi:acyl carrier protein